MNFFWSAGGSYLGGRPCTTPPQELLGPETPLVSGNRAAASPSSDSVLERSDELAPRKLGQESLRCGKKEFAYMPFFLDFTDHLKPTEVHAPSHIDAEIRSMPMKEKKS